MSLKPEQVRNIIYAKRSQYKSKKFTPKDLMWIWEEKFDLEKVKEINHAVTK